MGSEGTQFAQGFERHVFFHAISKEAFAGTQRRYDETFAESLGQEPGLRFEGKEVPIIRIAIAVDPEVVQCFEASEEVHGPVALEALVKPKKQCRRYKLPIR